MNWSFIILTLGLVSLMISTSNGLFFGNDNNNEDAQPKQTCYITYSRQFQTRYVTVQRPFCNTVYRRVCHHDYKNIESTEYDRKCRKDYENKCDTVYRVKTEQECNTVKQCYSATAYDSYGKPIDNCHDEVKCKQVSRQVPEVSCKQIPKEVCETTPKKAFQQIPFQNCENRPEKQCYPVPQRVPKQVPYSLPTRRCYQNPTQTTTESSGGFLGGLFG